MGKAVGAQSNLHLPYAVGDGGISLLPRRFSQNARQLADAVFELMLLAILGAGDADIQIAGCDSSLDCATCKCGSKCRSRLRANFCVAIEINADFHLDEDGRICGG